MQLLRNELPLSTGREGQPAGRSGEILPAAGTTGVITQQSDVWLTVADVAQLTGTPVRTIQSRCERGDYYRTRLVDGLGGRGQVYEILLTSLAHQDQVTYWLSLQTVQASGASQATSSPGAAVSLPEKARQVALRRADLIRLYMDEAVDVVSAAPLVERKKYFVARFNAGEWPELRAELGELSFPTVERWRKQLQDAGNDPLALAPKHASPAKGKRGLDHQAGLILAQCALRTSRPRLSEVIRDARKAWAERGLVVDASDATIRRALEDLERQHADVWTFMREGRKSLEDKHMPYIERDRYAIEAGDLVVADGHTLNFTILNPETGKPKRMTLVMVTDFRSGYPLGWEIMPTENTQAIASAYRMAIRTLGFVPREFYLDNGRAFRAKFFKGCEDFRQAGFLGLFERLGSLVKHAQPYHGQSKPIERFFGSLAEFERSLPTFTGTGIDDKPAHLLRGETFHRDLAREVLGEHCNITLREAHVRLAEWIDEFVNRPSEGLDGYTPAQVLHESIERVRAKPDFAHRCPSEEELTLLMMDTKVTTLYQNGIRFLGRLYYHDALFRHDKGRGTVRFLVRYDLADTESILVFTPDGRFVCRASVQKKIHPAARTQGTPQNVIDFETAMARKRNLFASTAATAKALTSGELERDEEPIEELNPADEVPYIEPKKARTYVLFKSDQEDGDE